MSSFWSLIWQSMRTHVFLTALRPTFQIVLIAQPIILTTIAAKVYGNTPSPEDLVGFVVIGSGIAGVWSALVYSSAGDINRERSYGTLGTLLQAPAPLTLVMAGKLAANAILASSSLLISIVYAVVVLKIAPTIAHPLAFVGAMLAFLASTSIFALVLSCLFLLSRSTTVLQNFLEYPLLIVSGVFFPLTTMPVWVQFLGLPLPLTWSAQALRETAVGAWDARRYLEGIGGCVILSLCYTLLAYWLFASIERRIRTSANLDAYY